MNRLVTCRPFENEQVLKAMQRGDAEVVHALIEHNYGRLSPEQMAIGFAFAIQLGQPKLAHAVFAMRVEQLVCACFDRAGLRKPKLLAAQPKRMA